MKCILMILKFNYFHFKTQKMPKAILFTLGTSNLSLLTSYYSHSIVAGGFELIS